jgi:hypothetical protein
MSPELFFYIEPYHFDITVLLVFEECYLEIHVYSDNVTDTWIVSGEDEVQDIKDNNELTKLDITW